MQETQIRSLGQEDLLEKEMANYSVFLPGKSCGQKESGGLQSMGSQKNQTKQQQSRQCGIQVRTNIQYID